MIHLLILTGFIAYVAGAIGLFFKYSLGKYALIPAVLGIIGFITACIGILLERRKTKTSLIKAKFSKTSKTSALLLISLIFSGLAFIAVLIIFPRLYFIPLGFFSLLFAFSIGRMLWIHYKYPYLLKTDFEIDSTALDKYRKRASVFTIPQSLNKAFREIRLKQGRISFEEKMKESVRSSMGFVGIVSLIFLVIAFFKPVALIFLFLFYGIFFLIKYFPFVEERRNLRLLKSGQVILGMVVKRELNLTMTKSQSPYHSITVFYEANGFPYLKNVEINADDFKNYEAQNPLLFSMGNIVILMVSYADPHNALIYELSDYEVVA